MSMDDEKLRESTLESEFIFNGRLLKVYRDRVQLPNGHESQREFIRHQGAVGILPILDDGSMIFVRQFRYPVKKVLYEIPAGKIEGDEAPLSCAKRELSEESGYTARDFKKLTSILTTPGFTDEQIHLYAATGLTSGKQHPDEDEFLNVVILTPEEVKERVLSGEICDAKSLCSLYLYDLMKRA